MKPTKIILLILLSSFTSLSVNAQKYVFYLHGAIIEYQGPNAVDTLNGYGAYRYYDILDSLRKRNLTVISEVRKPNTDVKQYSLVVAKQIDSLLAAHVNPSDISVIGASKGSVIAMHVSTLVKNNRINYIFMAACSDDLRTSSPEIKFHGSVLSIYEKSDMNGTCNAFKKRSETLTNYKEIALNTGLRHGFFYRPIAEWLDPATRWINNIYK